MTYLDPADEPDDPNMNAGSIAVANASAGDWTLLRARLCDPAVTLTMFEREWLARERLPGRPGRHKETQEPLLCWWFQNAEGMDRNAAIARVCKLVSKSDRNPDGKSESAVMKALQRAGGESYDPGDWWHQRAQWYRDGNRNPYIFPPALRPKMPDFAEFLRNRTE